MKPNKSKKMATAKKGGKPTTSTEIRSAALSGEVFPLVLTQGELIEGTFSVERTATDDILRGIVTDWKGLWKDYHFNYADGTFRIVPGGQGDTNYGNKPQIGVPFPFTVTVPHGGVQQSYFFGVSSNGGFNVAGKTLIIG